MAETNQHQDKLRQHEELVLQSVQTSDGSTMEIPNMCHSNRCETEFESTFLTDTDEREVFVGFSDPKKQAAFSKQRHLAALRFRQATIQAAAKVVEIEVHCPAQSCPICRASMLVRKQLTLFQVWLKK